jgi:TRAP-type C4-dicarboxylate transport system permease small subunit
MESVGKYVRSAVKFIGYLGMLGVVVIMLIMTVDVILRYFFNKPFLWSFDLVEFVMVGCVFFGLAYTELRDGHVNITLVFDHFPPRIKPFISILNHLIMLAIGILITWQGYVLTADSFRVGRVSTGAIKMPEGPVDSAIFIGGVFFSLLLIVKIYEDFHRLKTGIKA